MAREGRSLDIPSLPARTIASQHLLDCMSICMMRKKSRQADGGYEYGDEKKSRTNLIASAMISHLLFGLAICFELALLRFERSSFTSFRPLDNLVQCSAQMKRRGTSVSRHEYSMDMLG